MITMNKVIDLCKKNKKVIGITFMGALCHIAMLIIGGLGVLKISHIEINKVSILGMLGLMVSFGLFYRLTGLAVEAYMNKMLTSNNSREKNETL